MITMKAYIKTEGTLEYRECKINYYTYAMVEAPQIFHIIVNVELHGSYTRYIKTLSIDNTFDNDQTAINFGIEQGKRFIDHSYELGKIAPFKPPLEDKTLNNKRPVNNDKIKNAKPRPDKK